MFDESDPLFVIARLTKSAEAISGELMGLPRTFQVLAMTEREGRSLDEIGATTKIWR
jgi:hypothetical protein